ncbi:hypothetical protein C8J57DRAFT_1730659 [Mycena rebaudengoi]|nr:hypothetical protein C8J57DRAFT_1730659 [Mycena rebaudengoi]
MWFGPSAAAGAGRTLFNASSPAAWAFSSPPMARSTRRRCTSPRINPSRVIVACVVVRLAHHSPKLLIASLSHASHRELHIRADEERQGDRPVLLPLGIRLGLDGVNPMYYETIKMLYTFPLSGDGLFYLDLHHSRPAVPLRLPPTPSAAFLSIGAPRIASRVVRATRRVPQAARRSLEPRDAARAACPPMTEDKLMDNASGMTRAEEAFYLRACSLAELRTFHDEKVYKMPLDPTMIIGFVFRYEVERVDLRRRITLLPRMIFAIQDEPPTWLGADDDDERGLESISDPEEGRVDAEGVDDGEGNMRFFDKASSNASHGVSSNASHAHSSTHYHSNSNSTTSSTRTRSKEDTEEDPVAPNTPLPTTTRFDLSGGPKERDGAGEKGKAGSPFPEEEDDFLNVDAGWEDDIEDDWVDPPPPPPVAAPAPVKKSKSASGKGKERKEKKKRSKTKKAAAVPVPNLPNPLPVSVEDGALGGGQQQRAEERERERQRNHDNMTGSSSSKTAPYSSNQATRASRTPPAPLSCRWASNRPGVAARALHLPGPRGTTPFALPPARILPLRLPLRPRPHFRLQQRRKRARGRGSRCRPITNCRRSALKSPVCGDPLVLELTNVGLARQTMQGRRNFTGCRHLLVHQRRRLRLVPPAALPRCRPRLRAPGPLPLRPPDDDTPTLLPAHRNLSWRAHLEIWGAAEGREGETSVKEGAMKEERALPTAFAAYALASLHRDLAAPSSSTRPSQCPAPSPARMQGAVGVPMSLALAHLANQYFEARGVVMSRVVPQG